MKYLLFKKELLPFLESVYLYKIEGFWYVVDIVDDV